MTHPADLTTDQTAPRPALLWLVLLAIGLGWGATGPFSKLAVSTGNHPIGVTFWNTAIGAVGLTSILLATGRRLPYDRRHLIFFIVCGFLGTALPNSLSYTAYQHLPIGVNVMVIALVPMATMLIALPLGIERLDPLRVVGLGLGTLAVLLIALPETSLPEPGQAIWVALPVIVSLAYAGENIYISTRKPPDCGALTVICGLSWGALILLTPAVVVADAWVDITRFGPPEQAIIAISFVHMGAYFGFIWLIGQAGPIFASQVGYVVTASGVVLGMAVYGERHSPWVWAALALMFAGLALVKPRR
ncbi:MAG TPA: DMT family transporter [Thermohalobaculum sp.]|nr:DMT family transporter [Thermohalobaculum sp.]